MSHFCCKTTKLAPGAIDPVKGYFFLAGAFFAAVALLPAAFLAGAFFAVAIESHLAFRFEAGTQLNARAIGCVSRGLVKQNVVFFLDFFTGSPPAPNVEQKRLPLAKSPE